MSLLFDLCMYYRATWTHWENSSLEGSVAVIGGSGTCTGGSYDPPGFQFEVIFEVHATPGSMGAEYWES